MKYESGREIMTLKRKRLQMTHITDDGSEDENTKDTKQWVIKRKLKFENYKNSVEPSQLEKEINYLEKNLGILKKS